MKIIFLNGSHIDIKIQVISILFQVLMALKIYVTEIGYYLLIKLYKINNFKNCTQTETKIQI